MEKTEFTQRCLTAAKALREYRASKDYPVKIVLVGEQLVDYWVFGSINGKSQDAPCDKFVRADGVLCPGGAGAVRETLHRLGVQPAQLIHPREASTRTRYVDVNSGRVAFRVDKNVQAADTGNTWQVSSYNINGKPWLLAFSDYGQGQLQENFTLARAEGVAEPVAVWVDPHPTSRDWLFEVASLLSYGSHEAERVEKYQHEFNCLPGIRVTRCGDRGATLCVNTRDEYSLESIQSVAPRTCVSACAAGDAHFGAMLAVASCLGDVESLETLRTSTCFANLYASLKCENYGSIGCVELDAITDSLIKKMCNRQ